MKVPLINFLMNGKSSHKYKLTRRKIFIFVAVLTTLERMQISDDSLSILCDKSSGATGAKPEQVSYIRIRGAEGRFGVDCGNLINGISIKERG